MAYTDDQRRAARIELARRELARRQQTGGASSEKEEDVPYTPPPPRTGWGAVGEDIGELPGKTLDYAMDLPNQIGQSAGQVYNEPGRAIKNLLAGVGELGVGTLNLPHEAIKYLGEKQVIPEWLKKYNETGMPIPFTGKNIPTHVDNLGAEEAIGLGGEPHEGDKFLRELPGIVAGVKAFKSIPGVKGSGKKIAAQFQRGPLKRKVEALEKQHEEATGEHTAAMGEYNALKDFLESQAGFETSNPNALTRKATEAQQALKGLQEQSAAVPAALRATEEPVRPEISEEPIRQTESLLKTNAQKSAEHEAAISQYLGKGNAHRKRVAEKLNPILEERQAVIGRGYDSYLKGLKDKQVTLSNPRDAKTITADIQQRLKQGDTTSKEILALDDELANLGKGEVMPADKFVSAYRSLRQMAQRTRSSAYGKSPQEFDRLTEAADSMDADVSKMSKIIDSGLGKENLDELHKLNHRYATEIAPLFKNKFFQHMQANNKAPANMIEQLTNEPYIKSTNPNKITGTQILNEIIKGDPELLQNVVGERFAHKPEALHEWDEAAHGFIQHMPELQELRGKHFESKQAEAQSKIDLDRVKQEHQMQREQKDEEHKGKAEYYKMQQDMKALDERHAKLTDSTKKMKEKAKNKNLTLKQKLDIEHELAQTKKKLSSIDKERSALKKTAKFLLSGATVITLGSPVYAKIKSFVNGS